MLILIAEDNEDNLEILTRRLQRKGHDLICARDGQEALDMARDARPDIILMDISMPILSGIEATQQIRKHPPLQETPIIALTAHAMASDRETCLSAGCTEFATKPIDFKALLGIIERLTKEPSTDHTASRQTL